MERRHSFLIAATLAVGLLAGSSPRVVGDGHEYLAMALNLSSLHGPSFGLADIRRVERSIGLAVPSLSDWSIRDATVAAPDRRRDFLHFWVYPLLAVPFVWGCQLVGGSPLVAFTLLNLCLLALALWKATSAVGRAACLLLFASPIVWWLDKAHTEVFTFSLLVIAFVTIREQPWWAMIAAGLASTQNPPIALLVPLIAVSHAVASPERRRQRHLYVGAVAGLALAAVAPLYTLARHGTTSLLLLANPAHPPAWAEIAAVPFDPIIGLVANFPFLLVATLAAIAVVLRAGYRALLTIDCLVAACAAVVFPVAFSQATNMHSGGTPSLSRYAVWLIPLAVAPLAAAYRVGGAVWTRALWGMATASALISVFVFHPAVAENAREPTSAARYLWERHPAWNNPLPEVFAETWQAQEGRELPVASPGCDKILLLATAAGSAFPIPCFPATAPPSCLVPDALCYANRSGKTYAFVQAPGGPPRARGFAFAPARAWPSGSEAHVREVLTQAESWDLKPTRVGIVRRAEDVRVVELLGTKRVVLILQDAGPRAHLVMRPGARMRGTLINALSGEAVTSITFDPASEPLWQLHVPAASSLMLLSLDIQ